MKKKRSNKSLDLSKIGKAIVAVAVSAKDVVRVAMFGGAKKAQATVRNVPKKAKGGATVKVKAKTKSTATKATPTKKTGTAGKKPVKKAAR
jgi:hypothetical protein